MKNFRRTVRIHVILASAILLCFSCNSFAASPIPPAAGWDDAESSTFGYWTSRLSLAPTTRQSPLIRIDLKESFSSKGEQTNVKPLDLASSIFGINISGTAQFTGENSLIRILLIDTGLNEHLIYEAYPLNTGSSSFDLNSVCEETCFSHAMNASSIKIELIDATVHLESASALISPFPISEDILAIQSEIKAIQNADKILAINKNIKDKGLKWTAGVTSVSQISYAKKKKLLGMTEGKIINLHGFEYYKGGVFEFVSTQAKATTVESLYVNSFDWRNRHGANKAYSPYYDGDPTGSGWLTSVKNQAGCGSCWAFAATGATEALVNLYFNQHLDIDLAEQDGLSCSGGGSCRGGVQGVALDFYTTTGVVDESCFPYTATDQPCSNKCLNPADMIQIGGKVSPFASPWYPDQYTEDELKSAIIEYGVLSAGVSFMGHAMALEGYYKDKDDGQTIWIFKNSWGAGWGENGHANIKVPINNFGGTDALLTPVNSKIPYNIRCVDLDGDGYYNWGISKVKPSSCPANSHPDKDCDDSDSLLGPYRNDGSCARVQYIFPSIAYDDANRRYLVVYESGQNIYGKFVDQFGKPLGAEFVVAESSGRSRSPSAIFDGVNRRYLVTWTNLNEVTSTDIFGQLVNADGDLLGDQIRISSAPEIQSEAKSSFDPSTQTFLIVWQDYRNKDISAYDIYAQRLDSNGNRVGDNFAISIDIDNPGLYASNNQSLPSVAHNDTTHSFLVSWTDYRETATAGRIYGQLISNHGSLLGANFTISENISDHQTHSSTTYDQANQRYIIVWTDGRNRETASSDIYGQLLDNNANPINGNFAISGATEVQDSPEVSYNPKSESLLLIWRDGRNRELGQSGYGIIGNWDVYGQAGRIANDNFSPSGENFIVSDLPGGQISPSLTCNSDLSNCLAVFSSYIPGGSIYQDWPEIDVVILASNGAIFGDLNKDQHINFQDYKILHDALGICDGGVGYLTEADLDGDGCITYSDYRIWYVQYKYYHNL
jgi:hypothetical protein